MRRLLALLALSLIAAGCSGGDTTATLDADPLVEADAVAPEPDADEGEEEAPETTVATTTTEAPLPDFDYVDRGDFNVGVATVTVDEGTDRPLTVDVWFPLVETIEGNEGPLHQYTLLSGVYYESPGAITTELTELSEGEFPLVIYSHGSGGQRWIHSDYTEFIASHGYIVVAPDHTGNTLIERFAGAELDVVQVGFNRVNDVKSVLDAVTGADATEPIGQTLAGSLTDDVIVTGHSFGGFTSYAIVSGVDVEVGAVEADDRVDAVITLAPATGGLTDDQLASVDVPHLVLVGDSDDTTPASPNVDRAIEFVSGAPSYRVDLVAAEHQTFTDLCDYREFLPQLETVPEFVIDAIDGFAATDCAETAMSIDRAQEITNTFAIRFLEEVTRGGEPLADDRVTYDDDLIFTAN